MNAFVHIAGWTLIHFAWQGCLIALAAGAALRGVRRSSANVRYLVACAGLAAMLAAPVLTASWLRPAFADAPAMPVSEIAALTPSARGELVGSLTSLLSRSRIGGESAAGSSSSPAVRAVAKAIALATNPSDRAMRLIVVLWMIGVAGLLGRMAAGWWLVRRLQLDARATPASSWQSAAERLSARLNLGRVAHVVESVVVEVPTVVGCLRPAIILPVAAIANLTPSQVEAILAHELAHIRRCDYAVNLAQTLAETLLFYHPAVWWLSSRIRTEREHCCDDIAVAMCGDAVAYAEALTELESWRTVSTAMAVAATGGSLLDRIRRILRVPVNDEPRSPNWAFTLALTLLFTAGAGGVQGLPGALTHAGGRLIRSAEARALPQAQAGVPLPVAPSGGIEGGIPGGVVGGVTGGVDGGVPGGIPGGVDGGITGLPPDRATRGAAAGSDPAEPGHAQNIPVVVGQFTLTPSVPPPAPPAPPTAPAPPALPAPAAAPASPAVAPQAPPAPPAPPSGDVTSLSQHNNTWSMSWSTDNQKKMEARAHGDVVVTDDLTDVQSISDGGYLMIREWQGLVPHTVEIKAAGGQLSRKYYVGGLERPWNDEARAFLARELAQIVRRSGFGAKERVRSILQKKGVAGVLEEVDKLEGDYVRRVYLQALIESGQLSSSTVLSVLDRIRQQMTSDYDRRVLLTAIAAAKPLDEKTASAYLPVIAGMKSDFDRREALNAVLAARPLPRGVAEATLHTATTMHSAFDKREVLTRMLNSGAALNASEQRALLEAAASIDGEYDRREVLVKFVQLYGVDNQMREPFFTAVSGMKGPYDKRMVLTALASKGTLSREVLQSTIDASASIGSDYDRAEILLSLVRSQPLDGAVRQSLIAAADALRSPSDQDRVLAAITRAERR